MATNFLFWFQVIMAWFYTVPQVYFIVTGETKGLTLVLYINFMLYLIVSLSLAVASYREKPEEKSRKQLVIIFSQWVIFIAIILISGLGKIVWRPEDAYTTIIILTLAIITIIYYRGFKDPFSRGWLAVWCKAAPQFWLAFIIFSDGNSSGLPAITLIAGHMTSLPRLSHVWLTGRKGGWDRPTKGLMLGESLNVISWTAVTILWIIFRTTK